MNAVGIDVSKGKSTVAILRPLGEVVSLPSYNIVKVLGTAASRVYFHLKAEAVRMGE